MTNRLYVANLSPKVTEDEITALFTEIGKVISVLIATDHQTRARKNYGFVEMETEALALAAVEGINGHLLHKRPISVTQIQAPRKSDVHHGEAGSLLRQQKRGGWRGSGAPR
jgi:RNA recognition motif-containing protein